MSIVWTRWPPSQLPYSKAQNEQPGLVDLLIVPAANAATLKGYLSGGERVGNVANPVPINPSGDYGHDHSGGWFGKPLFRSIATTSFHGNQFSNVKGPQKHGRLVVSDVVSGETGESDTPFDWTIWVPPCDPGEGAYVQPGIFALLNLTATTLDSTDTLQLVIRRMNGTNTQPEVALTVSSPQTTGAKRVESGASTRLPAVVGAMNDYRIFARVSTNAAVAGTRGCTLRIDELEFGVYST